MSSLFGGGSKLPPLKPEPVAPSPRDEEARMAAERMRRSAQSRGRQTTVLTQFTRRAAPSGEPRRTVIGAGGS